MSYLGVPYYHTGELVSTRKLAELCRVDSTNAEVKALIEGMGGRWDSARYFAERILKMGKYSLFSRKIRYRFKRLGEGKTNPAPKKVNRLSLPV